MHLLIDILDDFDDDVWQNVTFAGLFQLDVVRIGFLIYVFPKKRKKKVTFMKSFFVTILLQLAYWQQWGVGIDSLKMSENDYTIYWSQGSADLPFLHIMAESKPSARRAGSALNSWFRPHCNVDFILCRAFFSVNLLPRRRFPQWDTTQRKETDSAWCATETKRDGN